MRKQVVVFVGKRTKNWAIGLDLACQMSEAGTEVVLCDTRKFSRILRPISIFRFFDQKALSRKFQFEVHVLKRPGPYRRLRILKNAILVFKQLRQSDSNTVLRNILVCHYAPKLGTSAVSLNEITFLRLFKTLLRSLMLTESCSHFLNQFDYIDTSYLFNGREIIESSIIAELRERKLRIKLYERASASNKYEVYNTSPHNNEEWWEKINSFSHAISTKDPYYLTRIQSYIEAKKNGLDPFTAIKWRDLLDDDINSQVDLPSKFVVFFSVSTSEFSPFTEYNSVSGFKSQFEALRALSLEAQRNGLKVVIRRHPNSLGLDGVDRETDFWAKFIDAPSIIYIPPSSRANSYSIAEKSLAVFTWRSTIGFDTLCRGIPSYSLGPAKWAFDERVRAWDTRAIQKVLSKEYEFPDVSDLIEKYAAYMSTFGRPLQEFESVERWGYKIKNKKWRRNYALQRFLSMPSDV